MSKRVLFILKRNECYGFTTYTRRSSGLWNSTQFIVQSLVAQGVEAKAVEVVDNNCIDREITSYKPNLVVIEALWVVPPKFDVLKKLHPGVEFWAHLHSNIPFLALEGNAMDWIIEYQKRGVGIIANSEESYDALSVICKGALVYLPNVYMRNYQTPLKQVKDWIDIGCFGAIRPLKNQLTQALAAIQFAKEIGKQLRFHINGSRVETGGEPVLKNIIQLFQLLPDCLLVQHPWLEPEDFLQVLEDIDIGMQVSITETFNTVSADYVTAGIPMVVSKQIQWASSLCKSDTFEIKDIVKVMHQVIGNNYLVWLNRHYLNDFSNDSKIMWFNFVQ